MNGGLSAVSSTGMFAAKALRVLKQQQDCKRIKVSIHSGEEHGCDGLAISICRRSI